MTDFYESFPIFSPYPWLYASHKRMADRERESSLWIKGKCIIENGRWSSNPPNYRSGSPIETKLFTWKYNIIWKNNLEMWRESSAQLC